MSPRIEVNQVARTASESSRVEPHSTEATDNSQLLVPAGYAALGGTFELLMLMLEASKTLKDGTRQSRAITETAISKTQAEQVEDIRDKAALQMVGAVTTASTAIAGNTLTMKGSIDSFRAQDLSNQAELLKRGASSTVEIQKLQADATTLNINSAEAKTSGDDLLAISGATRGLFESAATSKDADSTQRQNQADALKRSSERLSSELDELKGNEDKLISYARDIEAAKNRCTQIALQSR